MTWAKVPVAWMAPPPSSVLSEQPLSPLHSFSWRDHKGAGIGALLVLICLSIQLNKSQPREKGGERKTRVHTSYNTLEDMTGLSKQTIVKAISLLEKLGATRVLREGRANEYELIGIEAAGSWRKLPQIALLQGQQLTLKELPRSRKGFNALKIFFAMLYLYSDQHGNTSLSYTGIERWSGVRRTEIRDALGLLMVYELVRPTYERDARHSPAGDNDQSTRYEVRGLSRNWSWTPPWENNTWTSPTTSITAPQPTIHVDAQQRTNSLHT